MGVGQVGGAWGGAQIPVSLGPAPREGDEGQSLISL